MLETMYEVMTTIASYFPDVPILPSIGNNDVDYHDQAPELDAAAQYYGDLWQIFFQNITANKDIANDQAV